MVSGWNPEFFSLLHHCFDPEHTSLAFFLFDCNIANNTANILHGLLNDDDIKHQQQPSSYPIIGNIQNREDSVSVGNSINGINSLMIIMIQKY